MLSHIVERLLPDHYTKTLVGSVVDQSVFGFLVQTHLPNLWEHMNKINLDLSTVSVPWFVCLYLNTVNLNTGLIILDSFFLDGSKFLFWFALSILKINESQLIAKGRDDDIFMNILRGYFKRLGQESSSSDVDLNSMKGLVLYQYTMNLAYGVYAGMISHYIVESLRSKYRLQVVHQMNFSNRRSQTRTLEEQVSLKIEEIEIVFDEVEVINFAREERRQHIHQYEKLFLSEKREEERLRDSLIKLGGWGMVKNVVKKSTEKDIEERNAIGLKDFRIIMSRVSPWKTASKFNSGEKDTNSRQVSLIDRIYVYSSVHFKLVRNKRNTENLNFNKDSYIADLATVVNILDVILKQSLNARLRFLFDIHDLDGDGFLSNDELKAIMDSMLEMFESTRHEESKLQQTKEGDEIYLKAVSSFLASALKLGSIKLPTFSESTKTEELKRIKAPSIEINKKAAEVSANSTVSNAFKLSFNEFLLAILSQSIFVQYFERIWHLKRNDDGILLEFEDGTVY